MSYLNKTISEFLKELSARSPVPGGGSAAALTGALGMGLLSMSARYSVGKKRPKDKKIQKVLRESDRFRNRMLQLVEEDVRSYMEVSRAHRLARFLPERRQRPFLEPSLRKALASALNICNNAHHGIHLSKILLEKGNPHLVSDVGTAAALWLFVLFVMIYSRSSTGAAFPAPDSASGKVESIGRELFTTYLLPFELVSFIILAAIIGAVTLAKQESRKKSA